MKQKIYTAPLFQNIVFLWLLLHIASNILLASFRFINSYLFFANPNYLIEDKIYKRLTTLISHNLNNIKIIKAYSILVNN